MVAIFTTASTLDRICHTDNYTVWRDIIMKVGVFIDSNIDIPLDMDDQLFNLDSAGKINYSKREFISSLSDTPENVLDEPCGIYLLDISEEKATIIQQKYGVICQSSSNLRHDVLTNKGIVAELVEGEKGKNWIDIFKKFRTIPTNSAIIIDAYLFDNDQFDEKQGCYDHEHSHGISNLNNILDQILPHTFSETYHIGILLTNTDEAKARKRSRTSLTNTRIASAINKLKKRLNRPYEISIEVIFFSQTDNDNHRLIHNRRILTNTYVLDAQYKLAAFFSNGESRASQTVSVSPLFELIHLDNDSDMKEKRLRDDLDKLSGYVGIQCSPKSQTGLLYRNGKLLESFSQIRHRFLKKP